MPEINLVPYVVCPADLTKAQARNTSSKESKFLKYRIDLSTAKHKKFVTLAIVQGCVLASSKEFGMYYRAQVSRPQLADMDHS